MGKLCFGTYARILQKVIREPNGNKDVVDLLLGLVVDNESITNQHGDPFVVTDKMASNLLGFKENVRKKIKDSSSLRKITAAAHDYFEDAVMPQIMPDLVSNLLSDLAELISSDNDTPALKRNEFLALATVDTLADFLSVVFLYALKKQNKQSVPNASSVQGKDELALALSEVAQIHALLEQFSNKHPVALTPPKEIASHEMIYVQELLAAYADAEGIAELPKEELLHYENYRTDFERRRKDYYAAESIRRSSRDIFGQTDPDQFDVLKNETYDGIIDVHALDFPNGFTRLNKVMMQAALIRVDKCLLSHLPDWIGASEKKGVCHILVNDGRIDKWVANHG